MTAMQTLSTGLAEACSKLKPAKDPSTLRVLFNKKPVDLSMPFRLANIPAGSTLGLEATGPVPAQVPLAAPSPKIQPQAQATQSQAPTSQPHAPAPTAQPQAPALASKQPHAAAPAQAAVQLPTQGPAQAEVTPPPAAPVQAPAHSAQALTAAPPQVPAQGLIPVAQTLAEPSQARAEPQAVILAAAQAPTPAAPVPAAQPTSVTATQPTPAAQAPTPAVPAPTPASATPPGQAEPMEGVMYAAELAAQQTAGPVPALAPQQQPTEMTPAPPAAAMQQPGITAPSTTSMQPVAATQSAPLGPPKTPAASALSIALELDRDAVLLTEEALQQMTASRTELSGTPQANDELPDEFFELTAEDYAIWARASEAKRKEESAGFKSKAKREQEARAKAEAFGSVPVRVHLPGKLVLQVAFSATETIGALQTLVQQILQPDMANAFCLYTTPPKQLLKDAKATLYQSGLVPAARVHLGLDAKKVPESAASTPPEALLKPKAVQHIIRSAPETDGEVQLPGQHHVVEAGQEQRQNELDRAQAQLSLQGLRGISAGASSSGAGQSSAVASGREGGPKVPKWLKLK